jgi:hypothetical protein
VPVILNLKIFFGLGVILSYTKDEVIGTMEVKSKKVKVKMEKKRIVVLTNHEPRFTKVDSRACVHKLC